MKETEERWVDVLGYEGLYKVSDQGRVWSVRSEKIMKPYLHPTGYLQINLKRGRKLKHHLVHRLVWESFNGPVPQGLEINHIYEDKQLNSLSGLELVTHRENNTYGSKNILARTPDNELTEGQLTARNYRRRYWQSHADEIKARKEKWIASMTPEELEAYRAYTREYNRSYYQRNRKNLCDKLKQSRTEKIASMTPEEYEAHRAKQREYNRRWRDKKKSEKEALNKSSDD